MKQLVAIVGLVCSVVCSGTEQKITDWMATYYLTRDDSRLSEVWDRTAGRGALGVDPHMRERLVGFFGAVFRDHGSLLQSRIKGLPKEEGPEQDGLALMLWLSNQDYSRALLRSSGLAEMAGTPVPSVGHRRILVSEDADFLYGWYCATGDVDALTPMLDFIRTVDWSSEEGDKAGYAAAVILDLCQSDARAYTHVQSFVGKEQLSSDARQVLEKALESKEANQSAQTTPVSAPR